MSVLPADVCVCTHALVSKEVKGSTERPGTGTAVVSCFMGARNRTQAPLESQS